MRKIVAAIVVIAASCTLGCSGCGSALPSPSTVVTAVQTFEQAAEVVVSNAQIAWSIVEQFIPASALPTVTTQYNNAIVAVNDALQALNDAAAAYTDVSSPPPNWVALEGAISDAIAQVIGIIDQYTNTPAVDGGAVAAASKLAPESSALAKAHAGLASLKVRIH